MPELPEVETVSRTLEHQIRGAVIKDVLVRYGRIIQGDPESFRFRLKGQRFNEFGRRGKYLLFGMDDLTLVVHLRMEGKFFIQDPSVPFGKHDHVVFDLEDGRQLRYNDVRKFGRMELIPRRDDYSSFRDLGPEPFSDEFNVVYCMEYLSHKSAPIKQILLDQSFVAGIGNIYSDEILFASKIHPLTKGDRLDEDQIAVLIRETRRILGKAIEAGGTTIRSYTSSLGVTGLFQLSLRVHDQEECPVCKGKIRMIRVGGRSTYYCEECQKGRKMRIAVSGGIGSGKSTVCDYLREKGYDVFDCDACNRKLLEEGQEGYLKVREAFPDCFRGDVLDKKELSKKIFEDPKEKERLEAIMHPLILKEMDRRKDDPLFAEVPLLFEAGWDRYFDTNLLVVSRQSIALERLKERGVSPADARRRLKSQMSVREKIKRADKIIYNNGSLQDLHVLVDEWLGELPC